MPMPAAAEKHQRATANAIDEAEREQRENEVDRAGDDDVEENAADAVAGAAIDVFGVVEDDVDAAPLLQDGERDSRFRGSCERWV